MPSSEAALARYRERLLPVFNPQLVLDRGEGAWVWDLDGKRYLDLLAGIAVNALGHAHPVWVEAVSRQAARLAHVSNLYATEPPVALADQLLRITGAHPGGAVFFANSGTEANEAALKAVLRGGEGRILALEGAFHGRTLGALSLTAKEAYRKPYDGFTGPVEFLPAGDSAALVTAFQQGGVRALVLEVIQGEAGVLPLPPAYLQLAQRLTREHGAWFWVDEIQTGCGRTGTWMAYQNPQLVGSALDPDLVTLAKGLGGGFPIGALVARSAAAAQTLAPGDHGTTFGGGPLAAAAAGATLQVIEQQGLLEHTTKLGAAWRAELAAQPGLRTVRGAGLLLGLVLEQPTAPAVAQRALEAGFLVNAPAPDVIRLAPPLILTPDQAQRFTAAWADLL
ncbi:MAG: acetylornithine transaminase [Bifidobacteriaceae bacterium]|jgi:acetylornithine aminotransferase|nr:acetylornithine transaminase [Bifidobacteriaceae bacterium]